VQTVGPLQYPGGLTDAQTVEANSHNISLSDWYVHNLQTDPNFTGSLYGPNAGGPQQALDAAALADAKTRMGIA
jgi:hypothetical protein